MPTFHLVTGDLEENCYAAWREGATQAVIFDPGWDADNILAELETRKLMVVAFLLTHCHGDDIGALGPLKDKFKAAPIYVPEAEASWLSRPTLNLSYFYGKPIIAPPGDVMVQGGETIDVAGMSFKTIHVPGHSPGGMAYFLKHEHGAPELFCGDILFSGSIGRTDLPGGSGEEVLVEGIREKLFVLPNETIVYPGHGGFTTIGEEKRANPYCGLA